MAYVWLISFILVCGVGVLLTIGGLPGTWVMVGAAALMAWLGATLPFTLGWWVVAALVAIALVGEAIDFGAGALGAARAAHPGRVVAVFQPHRYSRTRDCFEGFMTAFNDCDVLIVTEIYAAGEEKIPGAEGHLLAEAIRAHGHRNAHFVADLRAPTPSAAAVSASD